MIEFIFNHPIATLVCITIISMAIIGSIVQYLKVVKITYYAMYARQCLNQEIKEHGYPTSDVLAKLDSRYEEHLKSVIRHLKN